MTRSPHRLAAVDAFKDLSHAELSELEARLELIPMPRGTAVVRQGEEADALYIVVSGRFCVTVTGRPAPVAEIGAGAPIGEIAFFAGGRRTATVTAARDGVVLKLDRQDFEDLCARTPAIWRTILATLAQRLAAETAGRQAPTEARLRTLTVVPAGPRPLPADFVPMLARALGRHGRVEVLASPTVGRHLPPGTGFDSLDGTRALNELEGRSDLLLYICDDMLTPWSEKAIRQADGVLLVGVASEAGERATPGVPLNSIEQRACELHGPTARRLVLVQGQRGIASGTRGWLAMRDVHWHHHVALGDAPSFARLARFVLGRALGLVACGGGAFCAAHPGLYRALAEHGLEFDIIGGTSGGGAVAAALAMDVAPEAIDASIHDIFVKNRAFRRYTLPRYGLIDHTIFDRLLAEHYTDVDIEDLWTPFFAVSTNLSSYGLHMHRAGPLWHAVRATAAIPALLPPFYTADGQMLVDGCLLDNVPVRVMHEVKRGPNVVISFEVPKLERFEVDYHALPSRGELLRRSINPFAAERLPVAPGPGTVLLRSLMANRHNFERDLGPEDLLLVPPFPGDMGLLDWTRHRELMEAAYAYATGELQRLVAEGHPLMTGLRNGVSA